MQQPEAYIGGAADLFSEEGSIITKEGTQDFLRGFMVAFAAWVATITKR